MDKSNVQKKRLLFSFALIALALLVVIIIFKDEFSSFIDDVNAKLSVLSSLMIGAIIAYLMNPVEKFFFSTCYGKIKNHKGRKFLSILSAYILVIGMIVLFVVISLPQIAKSIGELPARFQEFATMVSEELTIWYTDFIDSEFYLAIVEATGKEIDINEILASLGDTYLNIDTLLHQATEYLIEFVKKLYTGISDTFIGLIFSIYILADKDRLRAGAKKITTAIVGKDRKDGVINTAREIDHAFGGFIQGKIVNAIIIFVLTFIAFWAFGIPYPQLLALIIGITDIIPVFGPFIGAIPSAFIVLIAAPEKVILMLIIILVIQQIDGNYIGPKILGESTGLSAIGVFVAIIVMGGYFGIVGMLIGVPTFAVASSLISKAVDRKLTANGVSVEELNEDAYYENGVHNNLFTKIIDAIIALSKSIFFGIVRFFKKMPKIRKKSKIASIKPLENEPDDSSDSDEAND